MRQSRCAGIAVHVGPENAEAKEIAHALNDRKREALLLGSLGNLYQRLDQLDLAEQAYREQLAIAQERGDRRNESNALLGLANVLRRIQPEAAAALYQQQLAIARELGDLQAEAAALFNRGLCSMTSARKKRRMP